MPEDLLVSLLKGGAVSGTLIALALLYLAIQVRGLEKAVDKVSDTLGKEVLPKLTEHEGRIGTLEGRLEVRS